MTGQSRRSGKSLSRDAEALHRAVSDLVRIYQYRDRHTSCYGDVTVTECYALTALVNIGPMSLQELATELHVNKSTASRVVDSLEAKSYVTRETDPDDARGLVISANARGGRVHNQIERQLVREMEDLLAGIDSRHRGDAVRLIRALADSAARRFEGLLK